MTFGTGRLATEGWNRIDRCFRNASEFSPEHDAELFAAAPASSAVFVLRGAEEGSEPYVSKTANLRRRLQRLLGRSEGRKLNLRDRVRWVEWTPTGSDFEASFLLYKVLRREFPKTYDKRLRLRFAPLVKLILNNPYPRATVTTRISGLKGKLGILRPIRSRGWRPRSLPTTRSTCSRCAAAPTTCIPIRHFPAAFIPR